MIIPSLALSTQSLAPLPEKVHWVSVGKDLSDRFDPWFFLKVTRDGDVLRIQENPETKEEMWVPDRAPEAQDARPEHQDNAS